MAAASGKSATEFLSYVYEYLKESCKDAAQTFQKKFKVVRSCVVDR